MTHPGLQQHHIGLNNNWTSLASIDIFQLPLCATKPNLAKSFCNDGFVPGAVIEAVRRKADIGNEFARVVLRIALFSQYDCPHRIRITPDKYQLGESHVSNNSGLSSLFKIICLALSLWTSMTAQAGLFGSSKSWKEEVPLHDGQKMVVERHFNLGPPSFESRERKELDETITFTPPGSNKEISWKTEFRDDLPELNSLGSLLLDVVDGIPYLATSPAGCISYNKWHRPNPPYIFFKYENGEWKRIPIEKFPAVLVHSNLMSTPDSRTLKSFYTLAQVKEQMAGGTIATEATTIYRKPVTTWLASCPNLVPIKDGWGTPGGFKSIKSIIIPPRPSGENKN